MNTATTIIAVCGAIAAVAGAIAAAFKAMQSSRHAVSARTSASEAQTHAISALGANFMLTQAIKHITSEQPTGEETFDAKPGDAA